MYRLLIFLRRIHLFVIFLILEGVALHYYARSTAHSRARLLSVSDAAAGKVYGTIAGVEHFMSLGRTNRLLESRVEALENELALWREDHSVRELDSMKLVAGFHHDYISARVVRNSISKRENFFTVDRGTSDGVERGMAVVTLDGCMVGYVLRVSAGNAICMSVLNSEFRASGMFRESGHFGSISWEGKDGRIVRLTEVPKYANIERGDTVITRSSLNFPEGVLVGTVENFSIDEARASYNIDVKLGADVATLRVVMLIKNPEADERLKLEQEVLGTIQSENEIKPEDA